MHAIYLPLVDIGLVYDNSDVGPVLVAERHAATGFIVHDRRRWALIEEACR
jgi:predicted ABC-type ATPase